MNKFRLLLVVILGLLISVPQTQGQNEKKKKKKNKIGINKLTRKEKAAGWELLFDGKTADKWRNYKDDEVKGWDIEDGNLIARGRGEGDIITKEQFENFELYIEWKIGEKANSGIFFNVVEGEKDGTVYATGPEYQLLDDASSPDTDAKLISGANYDMHPAKNGKVKPLNEYNSSRIIVNNGQVEHWLNGTKVVQYQLWTDQWKKDVQNSKWKNYPNYGKHKKGHLGIQDHGGEIYFRNIKVKRL
ncbi:DUF1080 domain-containing protein [Bacteroidota bacterium]